MDDFNIAGYGIPPSIASDGSPITIAEGGNFNKVLILIGIGLLIGFAINYLDKNAGNRQEESGF